MTVLMRIFDIMQVPVEPGPPCYLKTFDIEAYNGGGTLTYTSDWREAHQFKDAHDLLKTWGAQSTTRPLRGDGKPNRPLTSCSIEIVPLETAEKLSAEHQRDK